MACNTDLVQYVVDQCADAGEITAIKMFGDWLKYTNRSLEAFICESNKGTQVNFVTSLSEALSRLRH
ncbi:MAG: DUF4180 domain-containing protein [Tannerella sp.]|uniref:DUF4180 domain-containing protein n=1 Tax=Tannerella sp. TaxID=2382127 RepID=UPI003FA23A68